MGQPLLALDLKNAPDAVKQPLCSSSRLERAIGVIYRCAKGPCTMHRFSGSSYRIPARQRTCTQHVAVTLSTSSEMSSIELWQLTLCSHSNSGCDGIVHRGQLTASAVHYCCQLLFDCCVPLMCSAA